MKKVFAEIGFGNDSFLSTENVFILSTNNGFEVKKKDRNKLKILLGISGENQ